MFKLIFHKFFQKKNDPNKKNIVSALSYGSASVITQILMMVYLLIAAEWLGAEKYGHIAAAYAAASLTSFLFNLGFNQYMMKAGSTIPNPRSLGGTVLFIKSVLGILWGCLLFFALRSIRPDLYLGYIIILTILELLFDSLFGTFIVILLLEERAKLGSILLSISRLARLMALVSLIIWGSESIFQVLLLRLLVSFFIFILSWLITKPAFDRINKSEIFRLLKHSSAYNASELLSLIYINADVNILVWFGASPSLIANYSIVISLISAVITLPSGIYNVLLPSLVRSFIEVKQVFYRKIRLLYIGFSTLAVFLWIGVVLLSKPVILAVLGQSYLESITLLISLSPLFVIRTVNQANIAYLISVGRQAKRLLPQFLATILKLGLAIFAVIYFQTQGMVIVAIIAEMLLFFAYILQIIRHKRMVIKSG